MCLLLLHVILRPPNSIEITCPATSQRERMMERKSWDDSAQKAEQGHGVLEWD